MIAVRPEIVDDILPDVKQRGQTAYLNCSVINMQAPATVSILISPLCTHSVIVP